MDWLQGIRLDGVPWWAAFALMLLTFAATKGIDALIKLWKVKQEERQYADGQTKEGYVALIADLKEQVKELKGNVQSVLAELKDVRAAHINCEINHAELRGIVNVLNEKVSRLEGHDKANADNTKKLAEIVKAETGKAPTIV